MKRIVIKRILPLLCAGLLLCIPQNLAYATEGAGSEEGTTVQTSPPAEETPPPTEETPPPKEETPPPKEETPPPKEETPPPKEETPPPKEETPPPIEETPPPTEETPPPTEETPPPTEETPPPIEETPPPKEETPPPKEETPPPEEETPPPKEETPPPIEETLPPIEIDGEQTSYNVEIAWESLELDYVPLWNPDEHRYDGWESTESPITVKNMTKDGAPIRVTLTFAPAEEMGTAAVFSPCEGDPNPDDFELSDGQVSFLLPRDARGETQATVNLSLSGDPAGWETQDYTQIGAIKTEIVPLDDISEGLEEPELSPEISDVEQLPVIDLPLPEPTPPNVEEPIAPPQSAPAEPVKPESRPAQPEVEQPLPDTEEQRPPEAVEKPPAGEPEITPDAPPPPENIPKEELQVVPSEESGAPPQEEPQ